MSRPKEVALYGDSKIQGCLTYVLKWALALELGCAAIGELNDALNVNMALLSQERIRQGLKGMNCMPIVTQIIGKKDDVLSDGRRIITVWAFIPHNEGAYCDLVIYPMRRLHLVLMVCCVVLCKIDDGNDLPLFKIVLNVCILSLLPTGDEHMGSKCRHELAKMIYYFRKDAFFLYEHLLGDFLAVPIGG